MSESIYVVVSIDSFKIFSFSVSLEQCRQDSRNHRDVRHEKDAQAALQDASPRAENPAEENVEVLHS